MRVTKQFEGWETYPKTLALESHNGYKYDYHSYSEQLINNSQRLFRDERVSLKVIEFGHEGKMLCGLSSVDKLTLVISDKHIQGLADLEEYLLVGSLSSARAIWISLLRGYRCHQGARQQGYCECTNIE